MLKHLLFIMIFIMIPIKTGDGNGAYLSLDKIIYITDYFDFFSTAEEIEISPEQVLAEKFVPYLDVKKPSGLGANRQHIWFKLDVKNTTKNELFVLQCPKSRIDVVDLHIVQNGVIEKTSKSGENTPMEFRPVEHYFPTFEFRIPKNETRTLLIHMQSKSEFRDKFIVMPQKKFLSSQLSAHIIFGGYYGIFLAVLFAVGMMYVFSKEKSFVLYALMISTFIFASATELGHAQYYFPKLFKLVTPLMTYTKYFSLLMALLFCKEYLGIKMYYSRINRIYSAIVIVCVLLIVAAIVIPNPVISVMLYSLMVVTFVAVIAIAFDRFRKDDLTAKIFLISWSAFFAGFMMWALYNFDIIHPSIAYEYQVFRYGFLIGNSIEMMIMSVGLALRLKNINEQAKQSEQNKNLLRVISHDVANPLSTMSLWIQRLTSEDMRKELSENALHIVGKITKACEHQASILENVRKHALLTSNQERVELVPVSIKKVLEDVEFIFSEKLAAKNQSLDVQYICDVETMVLADQHSLTNEVISNLVSNSIKFSPPDRPIEIVVYTDRKGVWIDIKNFGAYMPQERIANLFDKTKKVSTRGTLGEHGTGFGLTIAKVYLDQYGARIEVESKKIANDMAINSFKICLQFGASKELFKVA